MRTEDLGMAYFGNPAPMPQDGCSFTRLLCSLCASAVNLSPRQRLRAGRSSLVGGGGAGVITRKRG